MKSNQSNLKTQCAPAPFVSRASWIGELSFGELIVPVKAYSAIASQVSQIHQVHAGCGKRITQRKVCADHGELTDDEITKAYAYSPNQDVVLMDDELAQLQPADDKAIVVEQFFPPDELDLSLLAGRSLSLIPANLAAKNAYSVFVAALAQKRVWALGRTVFSKRRQLVVVRACNPILMLHTLHDPAQRRTLAALPDNSVSRAKVRALARTIDKSIRRINWGEFQDQTSEKLASLVEGKLKDRRNGKPKRRKSRAQGVVA